MYMINRLWFVVLSLSMLTSCGAEDSTVTPSTSTPISAVASTSTPAMLATLVTSATPISFLDAMHYQCLEIADSLPADERLKGVILYNGDFNLHSFLSN